MWFWRQQIESPAEDEKRLPQLTRIQTATTLEMASIKLPDHLKFDVPNTQNIL